jgi:uncharacterized protein (DUF1330 family)
MAAYVVLNIEVTDPERYVGYVKAAGATVEQYGGRYLVRGGEAEKLEGSVEPKRFVVLEFPSRERASAWWRSEEYRAPKAIRQSCAISDVILVDGV